MLLSSWEVVFCRVPLQSFGLHWCTANHLTISHYLQKSSDAGMESYIIQLGFSAAFDRVSQSGLLFKLKFIGVRVGGSWLSISIWSSSPSAGRESLLVVLPCSEWILIVSGVSRVSVWSSSVHPPINEMFELVENRLYASADDSTLLIIVRKPADRPTVAASLNRDFNFCFSFRIVFWTIVAVQRPSRRLHRVRLFFIPT